MDDRLRAYQSWAPDDALWTQWAKPVLFANPVAYSLVTLNLPQITWTPENDGRTALIVDRPGEQGILEGLAFAEKGFRPVPLYNGVLGPDGSSMIVNVKNIVAGLYQGAEFLDRLQLPPGAPPVFLLDKNRMSKAVPDRRKYDNRWVVFPQDMPSADYMLEQGVCQIVVSGEQLQDDLKHILYSYQKKGIRIFQYRRGSAVKEIEVRKPSRYKSIFYRFQILLGLRRNAAGGFGGWMPETSGSTGGHYYRMG